MGTATFRRSHLGEDYRCLALTMNISPRSTIGCGHGDIQAIASR
ncbi:MAG: hypothetical protein QNJ63_27575 [Calothrix sp. MO_192.B10]|nr:hypothetical protein [Calothrix sp. MO_192.B10]